MKRALPLDWLLAQIVTTAEPQHGLVTYAQLRQLGLSSSSVARMVGSGLLARVRPRVYRVLGAAETRHQQIRAAQLWAGEGAVASHRTGAEVQGLPGGDPSLIEVTSLTNARAPDLVVHRRIHLLSGDADCVDGIPVTSIERTVVDLAAVVSRATLSRALDAALLRPGVTLGSISARLQRGARQGRNGTTALRALLVERAGEKSPVESPLERDLLTVLRGGGIPDPEAQHVVEKDGHVIARLDFAYPDLKIGIELDGYAFHSSRESFERDRYRLTELTNEGWHMLVFTRSHLRKHPSYVRSAVIKARRARTSAFSGS